MWRLFLSVGEEVVLLRVQSIGRSVRLDSDDYIPRSIPSVLKRDGPVRAHLGVKFQYSSTFPS